MGIDSDALPAIADLRLKQPSGYGLRLGTMFRFDTWSVGPSLILWRIKESDRGPAPFLFSEPRNNTYEIGIKGVYHF